MVQPLTSAAPIVVENPIFVFVPETDRFCCAKEKQAIHQKRRIFVVFVQFLKNPFVQLFLYHGCGCYYRAHNRQRDNQQSRNK